MSEERETEGEEEEEGHSSGHEKPASKPPAVKLVPRQLPEKQPDSQPEVQPEQVTINLPSDDIEVGSAELQSSDLGSQGSRQISVVSPGRRRSLTTRASVMRPPRHSFQSHRGCPSIACLRARNSHFIERDKDGRFRATGKLKHLCNAFAFIECGSGLYRMLHLDSAQYAGVRPIHLEGGRMRHTLVTLTDNELESTPDSEWQFKVTILHSEREILARIDWAGSECSLNLEPNHESRLIIAASEATIVKLQNQPQSSDGIPLSPRQHDREPWVLELVLPGSSAEQVAQQVNVEWTLDLVLQPRPEKVGELTVEKCECLPSEYFCAIADVFRRLDPDQTGYAPFSQVWREVCSLCELPRMLLRHVNDGTLNVDSQQLVHVSDFLGTLDLVWETFSEEIRAEQKAEREQRKKHRNDSIEAKLRRLDPDILTEHPWMREWRSMSRLERWLHDYRKRTSHRVSIGSDGSSLALWRHQLVEIQGRFGESIYVFFEFQRYLFLINLCIALLFLYVILPNAVDFPWRSTSVSTLMDMLFGNEHEQSWWYYGSYRNSYGAPFWGNVGFAWVSICGLSVLLCILSVLSRILGSHNDAGRADRDLFFTLHCFGSFNFGVVNEDSLTLQQNSIMIRLHEMLLEELDAQAVRVSFTVVLRRVLGVLLTLLLAVLSAGAIVALLTFEERVVGHAEHYSFLSRLGVYIVPAGVAVIKVLTPRVIRRIVRFEKYSAQFSFQQEFLRIFVLRMFAILVTLFQTSKQVNQSEQELDACAESQCGIILYRFILFDLFLELLFTLLLPTVKFAVRRCCGCLEIESNQHKLVHKLNQSQQSKSQSKQGDPASSATVTTEYSIAGDSWKEQFDIPFSLLDSMYRQTVVMSGLYFAPMIPWLGLLSIFVSFFAKKRFLFRFCARPNRALGVVQQLRFFYALLLLAVVISLLPFHFFLNRTPDCGPHSGSKILLRFQQDFAEFTPRWLQSGLRFALSGLFLLPLLLLACVYIIYLRRLRNGFGRRAELLSERLQSEVQEKKQMLRDYKIKL